MFDQKGLPNNHEASIILDSVNQKLPFSVWEDKGVSISYVYHECLQNGFDSYNCLDDELNRSVQVDSPIIIAARYEMECDVGQFALALVPAILLLSVVFVLLWKKRKKPV